MLCLLAAVAAAATGCTSVNYTTPERYDRGLVVCLSGAGGFAGECDRIRDGLNGGGVDRAIEFFEWSRGDVLSDQTSVEANRRKAAELARHIEAYLAEHPGRPVHLVGVSAGTGVAVWALEELREGFQAEGAMLLASSLDARYNLANALNHVRDHLYSFNSVADTILSLGVTWAGTVDRGGGIAGGLVGFSPPENASDADKALYKERLVQYSWWPGDMVLGHLGDHLGSTNPTFVRVRLAPLVLEKPPPGTEAAPAAENGAPADAPKPAPAKPDRKASEPKPAGAKPAARQVVGRDAAGQERPKQRFFGWAVGRADAGARAPDADANRIDESQFFKETGRRP